ncbi:MAG TPA: glycosyltransferase [Thermoanaerobaculia bacterium]|nr:glycosyltransferase [Thermoanaerobaculia bacterium]
MSSISIAILGTRGVPARYGGFETFAAELGSRLAGRGHRVTVYCRNLARADELADGASDVWRGVRRLVLPAFRHKYLETVSHTALSAIDALRRQYDVVLLCNAVNAFVLPLLRAARIPVAVNVDGIERRRRKWNALGKAVYAAGESLSAVFADAVVADAHVIAGYYKERFQIDAAMIPYGAELADDGGSDVLDRLALRPRDYILYVSRFEPENNPLEVVLAYETLVSHGAGIAVPPLVMLGDGLYAKDLVAELMRHKSERVLFPGALYGADYQTLQRNALVYVQATEVGGTHPALIEAMGSGGCVLAHDTPENREVGGEAVRYFTLRPAETLSERLQECLRHPDNLDALRVQARERAARLYSWEVVTDGYEALFHGLVRR